MTEININNYEAYLLDLAEGELSSSDEKLLMLFLDKNPDLEAEHDLFELEKISVDNIFFKNKSDIKKTGILAEVSDDNFDELCIARIEGDLSKKEAIEFDEFVKSNVIKEKGFGLYKLTQNVPNQFLKFENKKSLKKKETKTFALRRYYTAFSVAASILVLLAVYLFMPKEKQNTPFISEVDQHEIVEKSTNNNNTAVDKQTVDKAKPKEIELVVEKNIPEIKKNFHRELEQIAYAKPLNIAFSFENENQYSIIQVDILANSYLPETNNSSKSLKSYLALRFNKRVLNKENKVEVEIFDIAQVGLQRVNKMTGTKMSLKRVYKENGDLDRTYFNSRLLAFSSPAKKD